MYDVVLLYFLYMDLTYRIYAFIVYALRINITFLLCTELTHSLAWCNAIEEESGDDNFLRKKIALALLAMPNVYTLCLLFKIKHNFIGTHWPFPSPRMLYYYSDEPLFCGKNFILLLSDKSWFFYVYSE